MAVAEDKDSITIAAAILLARQLPNILSTNDDSTDEAVRLAVKLAYKLRDEVTMEDAHRPAA